MSFSFFHAADLHLGSQFSGIDQLPEALAQRMINASLISLTNLVDLGIKHSISFLVLAGDIFETATPSLRIQKYFVTEITRLADAGIDVFMVTGNHDAKVFDNFLVPLPSNLYSFPVDSVQSYKFEYNNQAVTISGISYAQAHVHKNLSELFPKPDPRSFNLAILHCEVGGSQGSPYAPVQISDLSKKAYNYWALGHVHNASQLFNESLINGSLLIQYPGVTQGRHMVETGPKGSYLVVVNSDQQISSQFLAHQDILWDKQVIDLTQIKPYQLYSTINQLKENQRDSGSCGKLTEIVLSGATECHHWLQNHDQVEELLLDLRADEENRPDFNWIVTINDQTIPQIDWDQLRNQKDFLSELLKFIDNLSTADLEQLNEFSDLELDYLEILNQIKLLAVQHFYEGGGGE